MSTVRDRVSQQFSSLFVTLVSVLIGLVFADLAAEAHARMTLWPLTLENAFTLAQVLGTVFSAITVWIVYSHIGISRQTVATLSDTVIAFLTPAPMLIMTSLTGRAESWPWFYGGGVYLIFAVISAVWQNLLALREPQLTPFKRLLRLNGYLVILYTGAPAFFLLGWLDQTGQLTPLMKLVAAGSATPLALLCCLMFVTSWRKAVAEASAAKPAEVQPR